MDASWAKSCLPIYDSAAPCGIRCEASTKFAFIACGATMPWRRSVVTTRRAPTIYKWSYNLYKWSYFTLLTTVFWAHLVVPS